MASASMPRGRYSRRRTSVLRARSISPASPEPSLAELTSVDQNWMEEWLGGEGRGSSGEDALTPDASPIGLERGTITAGRAMWFSVAGGEENPRVKGVRLPG